MKNFTRIAVLAAGMVVAAAGAFAQQATGLSLLTAPKGSAFLPYGEGLAKYLDGAGGPKLEVKESKGSIENLQTVNASPTTLGLAFLGSAHQAVTGAAWANGNKHENVRALFPMYDTSFQIVALRSKNINSIKDLNGKKVGVGPAGGPAEVYFKAVAEVAGIQPVIVAGAPADLGKQAASGEIDALWQGAIAPIPALTAVQGQADAVVFGLTDAEVEGMLKKFPFMAVATVPAGAYKGQTAPIKSVSAWNFVIAHKDLPESVAYALTKAALSATDPAKQVHAFAAQTRAENVVANRILPLHPGAAKFYAEKGVKLP